MLTLGAAPAAAALRPLRRNSLAARAPLVRASLRAAKPQAAHQPRLGALRSLSAAGSPLVAGRGALRQHPTRRVAPLAAAPRADAGGKPARNDYNGVFLLILINVLLYIADHVLHVRAVSQLLYLHNAAPKWWQFITCSFCHASFDHLSGNLFMLLVFGKSVESEERAAGVWLAYLACGIGSAVASWLLNPAVTRGASVVSLGASGAVFGLYVISVFSKLSSGLDWRKLLEAGILGTFVWERIWSEISITTQGGGASNINHVAHVAGAGCGVALIWLLNSALPPLGKDDDDGAGGSKRKLRG